LTYAASVAQPSVSGQPPDPLAGAAAAAILSGFEQ
jgi:hypothetical protein